MDQPGFRIENCSGVRTHVNRGDLVEEEGLWDENVHAVVGAHHCLVEFCNTEEEEEGH